MRILLAGVVCFALAGCGGSGRAPAISARPEAALWDLPLHIVVSGLAENEHAEIQATASDFSGETWASTTAVRADSYGAIDLRGDAAMRILWSLRPRSGASDYAYAPPRAGERAMLAVIVRGRTVAEASVSRHLSARGVRATELRPATTGFYGELFEPAKSPGRKPGVLLFGGSEGGLGMLPVAALLASHGYASLAIAYFAAPGLPQNLLRIPLEYFAHALRWLARRPGVDPKRLVVMGTSRGSEAAQLVGIHYPDLVHAVVALVPSDASVCGIPRFTGTNRVSCIGPAWTFRGEAIPLPSGRVRPGSGRRA